ncbi:hypothetical protein BCV69DRAFT_282251 [Microstroma glucosiphilum]|uniref:Uncharacterized protein n=1 Tax=Pseudomicrostroma glucosiphilum TaxID=1684307 RepID=A0A316U8G1_9BASI|nr:hypothetical protein BCV69DRAFT_282251 [Pseudomicrostroma glucosiphilum]PWN21530.1 hypothetical protein BCV69DRAFT_282251 [Pseudomicrostroma glucosiphilum]
MLPPHGSQSASQSQSQSTQTTHTFVLQAYTQGRAASPDGELKFQTFTEPTLLCHVTEHTTTASQGLSGLRLAVEWALSSSSQKGSTGNSQLIGQAEEGKMTLESLNLCAFADIDSSQSSGSSAKRREAPLKGAHKGEVVAIRYRWPLKAEGSSRRLQLKFATVEDATTFVSLIQNVCPISTKQEKASTSNQAVSLPDSQDCRQDVEGSAKACSSESTGAMHAPLNVLAMSPLPRMSSTLHDSPSRQEAPAESAASPEAPAPPKPVTDEAASSVPSQVPSKKPVKKRAAPRAGVVKGQLKAAPKKRVKPNAPKEALTQDVSAPPIRPEIFPAAVSTCLHTPSPCLNVKPVAQTQIAGSQQLKYSLHSEPRLPTPPLKRNILLASGGLHGQEIVHYPRRAEKKQIPQGPLEQPLRKPATTDAQDLDVVLAGLCAKDRGELLEQTVAILKSPFFSVLVEIMERAG